MSFIIIWMNNINMKMFGFLCFAALDVKGGSLEGNLEVSEAHQFHVIFFKILVFIRIVVIVFVSELRSASSHLHIEAAYVKVSSSRLASFNIFLYLILFSLHY